MKWGHIRDLMAGQLEKIGSVSYDIFPRCKTRKEFEQMLSREHKAALKETLETIELLIRTGHWPGMSPKVTFFMRPRVLFAWKVTASMSTPLLGQPLPGFIADLEHHLAWALDGIWNTVGFEIWLLEEGNKFESLLSKIGRGDES